MKKVINARSIAELDKNNEIATFEITWARNIIDRIKGLFKKRDDSQR